MALDLGTLVGYVKMDHAGVKAGMDAAKREVNAGMDRIGKDAEDGGKQAGGRFSRGVTAVTSSGLTKLAGVVGGAFALEKVVTYLGDATQAACDLQQTAMKSGVIFGAQADEMDRWASGSVDAFGLSKEAALDAAAGFGDMLQQLGDTQSEAAAASQDVVQLAADLGSFNNLGTSEVLDMISASLRGEYDALQRVIPNINAARVEQEAMATSGKATASALTAQEKAHATLAIIQKDGARAAGDFSRSSGSLAIEQQKAAAAAEDLKAKVGEKLLPIMTAFAQFMGDTVIPAASSLVDMLSDLGSALGAVPGPIKAVVLALVAFHLLKGPLSTMLDVTRTKVTALGTAMKGLTVGGAAKASLSGISTMLGGPWGMAIGGATMAIGLFMQAQADADARVKTLTATLDKQTGAFTDNSRATIREALMGSLSGGDQQLLQNLGVSFTELTDVIMQGGTAWKDYQLKLVELKREHPEAAAAIAGLNDEIGRQVPAAQDAAAAGKAMAAEEKNVGSEAGTAAPKVADYKGVIEGIEDASDKAKDAQKDLAQAMVDVKDAAIDADEADANYAKTLTEAKEAADELEGGVNKTRTAFLLSTEAGQGKAQSLRDLARDARDAAKANLENGSSVDEVKDKMSTAARQFVDTATDMGLSEKAAKDMAIEYGLTKDDVDALKLAMDKIPEEVKSEVEVATGGAMLAIAAVKAALKAIKDEEVRIFITANTTRGDAKRAAIADIKNLRDGGKIPGYAGGTIIGPGTGTSDSILAATNMGNLLRVSNGEYISTAASTARNEAALAAGNRGATLGVVGAGGGPVVLARESVNDIGRAVANHIKPARLAIDDVSHALGKRL